MLMALLLVMLDEHSASEVIAGCVLGAIVSLAALYKLRVHRSPKLNWWAIPLGILFFSFTSVMPSHYRPDIG
ncbi:hypothetical protein ACFS07_02225 [Undibacterium arcticum]